MYSISFFQYCNASDVPEIISFLMYPEFSNDVNILPLQCFFLIQYFSAFCLVFHNPPLPLLYSYTSLPYPRFSLCTLFYFSQFVHPYPVPPVISLPFPCLISSYFPSVFSLENITMGFIKRTLSVCSPCMNKIINIKCIVI